MIQFAIDHPLLAYMATGIICAAIFTETQRWLLPLRIPAAEICKLANDLIANFVQKLLMWQHLNKIAPCTILTLMNKASGGGSNARLSAGVQSVHCVRLNQASGVARPSPLAGRSFG